MIRVSETTTAQTVSRIRAWLSSEKARHLEIAAQAGVNERTIRIAIENDAWNPTAKVLNKLESVMPKPKKRAQA